MKILLINNEFPPIGGGGSILNYEIATKLVSLGHNVSLITSSFKGMPRKETVNNFRVIRVPALRKSKSYSTPIELVSFFISGLFYSIYYTYKFKPDVIQAFFAVPSGGIAFVLNKLFRIPYSIYLGGSDVPYANKVRFRGLYPFISPLIKLFWGNCKFIIAPSEGLINQAIKADPGIKKKIVKITNGVDVKKFKDKSKKGKVTTILAVGRLIYRKGFQDLLKAVSELKTKGINKFRCFIVGNGDYENDLKKLSKKLNLGHQINFVGTVSYEKLIKYYLKSDIFVLPSYSEGMSLALIEAMAAKNAIIASDIEGNNEVVLHKKNGYLFPVGDSAALANYLTMLIKDNKALRFMQENAYQSSLSYDWRVLANVYNELYNRMIK